MRKPLFVIFCLASINSCKKDDPVPISCRIEKYTTSGLTGIFVYNDRDLLASVNYTFEYPGTTTTATAVLLYDSFDRLIKLTSHENSYSTFDYQSDGVTMIETQFSRSNSTDPFTETQNNFTFDSKGRVTKRFNAATPARYLRYEYAENGDLLKTFNSNGTSPEYLYEEYLQYDGKNYAFKNIEVNPAVFANFNTLPPKFTIFTAYVPHASYRQQNFGMYRRYSESGSTVQEILYAHQYNLYGYPTSRSNINGTETMGFQCR